MNPDYNKWAKITLYHRLRPMFPYVWTCRANYPQSPGSCMRCWYRAFAKEKFVKLAEDSCCTGRITDEFTAEHLVNFIRGGNCTFHQMGAWEIAHRWGRKWGNGNRWKRRAGIEVEDTRLIKSEQERA